MADALDWQTYRVPHPEVVPVVYCTVKRHKSYVALPKNIRSRRDDTLSVIPHIGLKDLSRMFADTMWDEPKTTILGSVLRHSPKLAILETPDVEGFHRRLVKPTVIESDSVYYKPIIVKEGLMFPLVQFPGDNKVKTVTAVYNTNGVYRIPRGYPELAGVVVGETVFNGRVDYDPYHGALYLENLDGSPVDNQKVIVRYNTRTTNVIKTEQLEEGLYSVGLWGIDTEPQTGVFHIEDRFEYTDARRLVKPEEGFEAASADYGNFDADSIATSHLWIVKTNADPDRIQESLRRVLPAGVLYRIESLPE